MIETPLQPNNEHSLPGEVPVGQLALVHSRKAGARSINAGGHRDKIPKSQSKLLVIDKEKKTEQEQERQECSSLRERLRNCIPNDSNASLFALVIIAYLACAITSFIRTGNASMLETLLPYVSAYVGLPRIAPLVPWNKK